MNKLFLVLSSIFGAMAVIAGAMLAHQLKNRMPVTALDIYDTAVRYQFYHVFALMGTGILYEKFSGSSIKYAGIGFIIGIILFSGSLYIISALLTFRSPIPFALGILTPIGGAGFIIGWIFLAMAVGKRRST